MLPASSDMYVQQVHVHVHASLSILGKQIIIPRYTRLDQSLYPTNLDTFHWDREDLIGGVKYPQGKELWIISKHACL